MSVGRVSAQKESKNTDERQMEVERNRKKINRDKRKKIVLAGLKKANDL